MQIKYIIPIFFLSLFVIAMEVAPAVSGSKAKNSKVSKAKKIQKNKIKKKKQQTQQPHKSKAKTYHGSLGYRMNGKDRTGANIALNSLIQVTLPSGDIIMVNP